MRIENTLPGLVSVIMPAYNCSDFIGEAIQSVIEQTYSNWEIIVVDDCSTDETGLVVNGFAKNDCRIKYIRLNENSGAAIARNTAIEIASGNYLAFLDSDDIWFKDKLEKQIHYMESNNYWFTCTSYTKIDHNGEFLGRTVLTPSVRDYWGLLKSSPGNSTVVYNADKIGKVTIQNIRKRNDYVMWLQVIKREKLLHGISEALGSHRIREGTLSSNKFSLVKYHWEVYRDIEQLSFIKSSYLVIYWIVVTVFKLR